MPGHDTKYSGSLALQQMSGLTADVWPYSRCLALQQCAVRIAYILGNNYKFIYFVAENASPIIHFSGMAVQ